MTRPEKTKIKTVMWRLLQARKLVTYDDLQELSGASRIYAQEWMATLLKREVVKKLSKGRYQLVCDTPLEPVSTKGKASSKFSLKYRTIGQKKRSVETIAQIKLWQAIVEMKTFSMEDLFEKKLGNKILTYQYIGMLVRAGFLKKDRKREYVLARTTGDAAPIIGWALYLFDPNTDRKWNDIPMARDIKKRLNKQIKRPGDGDTSLSRPRMQY